VHVCNLNKIMLSKQENTQTCVEVWLPAHQNELPIHPSVPTLLMNIPSLQSPPPVSDIIIIIIKLLLLWKRTVKDKCCFYSSDVAPIIHQSVSRHKRKQSSDPNIESTNSNHRPGLILSSSITSNRSESSIFCHVNIIMLAVSAESIL